MKDIFQVAIQYSSTFGSLAYDIKEKKVSVFFPIEPLKEKAEAFFCSPSEDSQSRRAKKLR